MFAYSAKLYVATASTHLLATTILLQCPAHTCQQNTNEKSKVTTSIETEEKKPWDLLWSSVLRPKTKKKKRSCLCKTGEQASLLPAPLIRLCTLFVDMFNVRSNRRKSRTCDFQTFSPEALTRRPHAHRGDLPFYRLSLCLTRCMALWYRGEIPQGSHYD